MDLGVFLFSKVASTETFIGIVLALFVLLIAAQKAREAAILALSAILMGASIAGLKILFHVERPPVPGLPADGYAFPSGHAASTMYLCVLAVLYALKLRNPYFRYGLSALAVFVTLAIGASRYFYNVHTPMQILAGYVLGAFWGALAYAALRYVRKNEKASLTPSS